MSKRGSKSKSNPNPERGAAAMGGHEEEEEEEEKTPHRLLVAQIIEKHITSTFRGHFLAIIGNLALPDFMNGKK